jgi:hypothetical protein
MVQGDGFVEELNGAARHVGIDWIVGVLAVDVAPDKLRPRPEDEVIHEAV